MIFPKPFPRTGWYAYTNIPPNTGPPITLIEPLKSSIEAKFCEDLNLPGRYKHSTSGTVHNPLVSGDINICHLSLSLRRTTRALLASLLAQPASQESPSPSPHPIPPRFTLWPDHTDSSILYRENSRDQLSDKPFYEEFELKTKL